ncbi:hypothetical protein MKW94_005465 [Papaver nudicaule]|uniref:UBC core domain-containing protein n=1 Tax=Papaver nudicaule TaxID=74823 RepID=A0AA41RPW7_PAPNU|nr:hypothetical protein [Papaver nudicaule]
MTREFKQFDIICANDEVNSISDHHYVSASNSLSASATKQIMKEWRILEKNLPDSIFVRVYEGRVDLLRAVIIGPTGTPYHDGLFFFDIQVPSNYPASPPKVHYRSFGYTLNPNLYSSGKVCLSLLNTWSGHENQKWNPSQSTILQVLVSIQGLVLNARPYYNEPGNGSYSSSSQYYRKISSSYNEDVFIMSCKTMMATLNRPPKSFEEFVSRHFRDRASSILVACNAYVNGQANIGSPVTTTATAETTSLTSTKFKMEVAFQYPRLVDSFMKNGSPLEIIELLDASKEMRKELGKERDRRNRCNEKICMLVVGIYVLVCVIIVVTVKIWASNSKSISNE